MTEDLQYKVLIPFPPDKVTVRWPVAPAVSNRSAGTRARFAYHFDRTSGSATLDLRHCYTP